jgi:FkbM family methyltransferase
MEALEARLKPFRHKDFFFVNVGANDGVMNDPIYPFIQKYGWRGIAVEPVPHVFAQLSANYRDLSQVILEQVAVAETPRPFWFVKPGSGSEEYAVQQVGSLREEYVYEALREMRKVPNAGPAYAGVSPAVAHDADTSGPIISDGVERFVERLDVECITFNDLMERHGVDHIDFLNIDAEGCDFEIFRSIDFERFRPEVLCIEVAALSETETADLNALLDAQDYIYLQHLGVFSHVYGSGPVVRRKRALQRKAREARRNADERLP